MNDCDILKSKYPKHIIYSANDVDKEMYNEVSNYFKILASYATGMINKIDISEKDVVKDNRLMKLFRTPIKYIVGKNEEMLNTSGIIELIEEYRKPIIVEG